jgi:hypothetical protein
MKKTKKQALKNKCHDMLTYSYLNGGIASDNEYNQFLCDTVPKLLDYMSVEGLEYLKEEMQRIYDNMLDVDKW